MHTSESNTAADVTILVVEDNAEISKLLQLMLQIEGHTVSSAANGTRALELARTNRPDLILLDVMLGEGELDGFEVARRLQASPETEDIAILFVTAKADVECVIHGLELGVDYIIKPFAVPELAARVRVAVRQIRRYRSREKEH